MSNGFIKQGFDISPRSIEQWALFAVNGVTHKLTTGDKSIDQYWGEIRIVGFSLASSNTWAYGDMIEIVVPPCSKSDPQPIRYLYWEDFFKRKQPLVLRMCAGPFVFEG